MAIGDNESTDDETDDSEDISMDDSDPSVISSDDETPPTTVDKYHWTRSSINTNYLDLKFKKFKLSSEYSTLVERAMDFAKEYMESFDSSHDFEHIRRVLRLAEFIAHEEGLDLDLEEIRLASLLHDYKDHKYDSGHKSDLRAAVEEKMVELGASNPQARKVALIVQNVSFTHEIKIKTSSDEQYQEYLKLIKQVPEIGVVQDADRLDAIGAIGIARCFTFTGAKTTQPLYGKGSALEHFEVKLVHLEAMMKTKTGRILAKTRTERLFKYQEWINQEI